METGPPTSDIPELFKTIQAIVVAALGVLGVWLVALTPKLGTKKQNQIDQLQEDLDKLRTTVDNLDTTVSRQRTAMNKMFSRDLAWIQRNWILEKSISELGGIVPVLPIILQTPIVIEE
jgi:uncharacterized membrane protein YccC